MIAMRRATRIVERNVLAYRRLWPVFITGFVEPLFFLLSIGVGVGELVGDLEVGGRVVPYDQFVAPGLLAMSAMTGALLDATVNFFVKFKYTKTYDSVLATPIGTSDLARGELAWSLLRGGIYSTVFLLTMVLFGLVDSWWAVLAAPVAVLIAFAFAGAGLAATTFMRGFLDFDYINLAIVPLFLFSATFFPITQYPTVLEAIVRVTPLYQGVVLERSLVLGDIHWSLLLNATYLLAMGAIGLHIASGRLRRLLQP
jgi:lipooligosaccharide transport system permease protein